MIWWVASIMASCAIAVIEYLNRTANYANFLEAVIHTGFIILIAQCGLFYAWKGAPSFMFAWAFFTFVNCVIRLGNAHFFVGEPISWTMLAGVATIMAGTYLVKIG